MPLAVLAIIVGSVFSIAFLDMPRLGGGWFWDFGNALGFLAFAGLLFQMIPRARMQTTSRHELLGYWVLTVALAHAFWFLAGDGAVRVYLQPGAPLYMWLGLAAIVAMALLTALARMPDRMRVHKRFRVFRTTHRALGFVVVAAGGLHIMMSGFYLSDGSQHALLMLLVLATCVGRPYWARLDRAPSAPGRAYLIMGTVAVGIFALARNLSW